jgi:polyhydroxybutyrate depolymerase
MRSATWWCLPLVMLGCSDPPSVTASDASPDVLPDVAADVAPDVTADVAPDVATDVAPVDAPTGACGRMPPRTGQWYETLRSGGVDRRFYVSVPANYDPARRYPVVFGLHGRDYDGVRMRAYLALEDQRPSDWAIFVYPDALRRTWSGNFTAIGWQNGPVATQTSSYGGDDDLRFIDDVVTWTRANLCTDDARFFATGQSWGGDFSNVVGCFRGTTFRAVAPVAANGDYYLPTRADAAAPCVGQPAVWAFHGVADPGFTLALGQRYRDFWVRRNTCGAAAPTPLTLAGAMADDTCVEYQGCAERVRWCTYNAASGHQVPRAYYPREVVAFFRSF